MGIIGNIKKYAYKRVEYIIEEHSLNFFKKSNENILKLGMVLTTTLALPLMTK